MNNKKYNVFSVPTNGSLEDKRLYRVKLNETPMTHKQACTMKSKFTPHGCRTIELVEVKS